jgi:hypothetical protein
MITACRHLGTQQYTFQCLVNAVSQRGVTNVSVEIWLACQTGWPATGAHPLHAATAAKRQRRPPSQRRWRGRCWCAQCCSPTHTWDPGAGCPCASPLGQPRRAVWPPTCSSCTPLPGPGVGPPHIGAALLSHPPTALAPLSSDMMGLAKQRSEHPLPWNCGGCAYIHVTIPGIQHCVPQHPELSKSLCAQRAWVCRNVCCKYAALRSLHGRQWLANSCVTASHLLDTVVGRADC